MFISFITWKRVYSPLTMICHQRRGRFDSIKTYRFPVNKKYIYLKNVYANTKKPIMLHYLTDIFEVCLVDN